ncbi:MAG: hypothetical protein P4L28_11205 [Paludibacteraceae bacterium]|nr:hypothetical protein [Paludibacteraceae bacterium]
MKALKVLFSTAFIAFGLSVFAAQGPVIIDENFQSFKEQGWKNDTLCNYKKIDSKASFSVDKTYKGNNVKFEFTKAAVTPTCETKKTPAKAGVSNGYVEVAKKDGSLVISEQAYISTIDVSASAAGDGRGFALYKSVKGGDWVKVGEYIGNKSEGADAQYGFTNTITINESNVSLKFAPTMGATKEGPALQNFRIHDIKAYGK